MVDISVIIPVYNAEKYLRKCLDSVCAQDGCVKEIIIVNDGSTDGSLNVCNEYADKDRRIKIINKENGGTSAAVIDGISVASCEYIGFADGDDYIEPNMFQIMSDAIEQSNADVCVCKYDEIDINGNVLHEYNLGCNEGLYEKENGKFNLKLFPTVTSGSFVSAFRWNKVFKKNLIINNIAYVNHNLRIGEDMALVMPVMMSANKIVCLNKRLYHYVNHKNSITHSYHPSLLNDCLTVITIIKRSIHYYDYSESNFNAIALAVIFNNCIRMLSKSNLKINDKKQAYKLIGDNVIVRDLLKTTKIKTNFKRKLIFKLLKFRFYGILSLVY